MLIDAGCDVNLGSQDHEPIFLAARLGLLAIIQARIFVYIYIYIFDSTCTYKLEYCIQI